MAIIARGGHRVILKSQDGMGRAAVTVRGLNSNAPGGAQGADRHILQRRHPLQRATHLFADRHRVGRVRRAIGQQVKGGGRHPQRGCGRKGKPQNRDARQFHMQPPRQRPAQSRKPAPPPTGPAPEWPPLPQPSPAAAGSARWSGQGARGRISSGVLSVRGRHSGQGAQEGSGWSVGGGDGWLAISEQAIRRRGYGAGRREV